MKMLLCEGNDALAHTFQAVFEGSGHAVSRVSAGQPAIDLALQERFDLMLIDQMLPGSLDGIEVVRLLRSNAATRLLPIYVMSTLNDPGARQEAQAAGATAFYAKPISPLQMLNDFKSSARG